MDYYLFWAYILHFAITIHLCYSTTDISMKKFALIERGQSIDIV